MEECAVGAAAGALLGTAVAAARDEGRTLALALALAVALTLTLILALTRRVAAVTAPSSACCSTATQR